MRRFRSQAGFVSAQVGMILLAISVLLAASILWMLQIRTTVDQQALSREVLQEEQRLTRVITALVRGNLSANEPRVFNNVSAASVSAFTTLDPRFPGALANVAPGFLVTGLDTPGTPGFFAAQPSFGVQSGGSPLDSLRQNFFSCPFAYVLSKRKSPSSVATMLPTRSGTVSLKLREIPITQFSLIAFEDLSADSGMTFNGTSVVLGQCVANGSSFATRLSPRAIPNVQIGATERVWEQGGFYASLLTAPTSLTDPSAVGTQQQNIARKGQPIYFDGQTATSVGVLPSAIAVATFNGVRRLVIDLQALPQTNVLIDSGGANTPSNRTSAYYIACTTPLARDRGVVIKGTSLPRLCDVVATNGAVILDGSHTGGPLMVASSAGGVYFNNAGDATWNAYLVLPAPSPFVSATSASTAVAGARQFAIGSGNVSLSTSEQGYDSISLRITPSSSSGVFQCGLGTSSLGGSVVWVEGAATTLRVGVLGTNGPAYSGTVARGSGAIEMTLSRSQNAVKLVYPGGVAYYSLNSITADRPRVETRSAFWSGSLSQLDIIASGAGSVIGAATSGNTIQLRGLLSLGTLTRFGSSAFVFTPSGTADPMESVAPRLIVLDR